MGKTKEDKELQKKFWLIYEKKFIKSHFTLARNSKKVC